MIKNNSWGTCTNIPSGTSRYIIIEPENWFDFLKAFLPDMINNAASVDSQVLVDCWWLK